jgi:hypothetical protein
LAQAATSFIAIHLWHHQINDEQIGRLLEGFLQALVALPGGNHFVTCFRQSEFY